MLHLWRWLVHFHDWNQQPPLRRRNVWVCKNRRRNVFVFRQHPVTMLPTTLKDGIMTDPSFWSGRKTRRGITTAFTTFETISEKFRKWKTSPVCIVDLLLHNENEVITSNWMVICLSIMFLKRICWRVLQGDNIFFKLYRLIISVSCLQKNAQDCASSSA